MDTRNLLVMAEDLMDLDLVEEKKNLLQWGPSNKRNLLSEASGCGYQIFRFGFGARGLRATGYLAALLHWLGQREQAGRKKRATTDLFNRHSSSDPRRRVRKASNTSKQA